MTTKVGFKAKAYVNTGTWAVPVWSEITIARDVQIPMSKGEVDVSSRGNAWKLLKGGMKEWSFEFDIKADLADANYEALRDSYLNDEPVELAFMSGDITQSGEEGPHAVCEVFQFTKGEPLEGAQTFSVVAKPTEADDGPEWKEVS